MPHLMKLPDGSDELFFSRSDLLTLIREKLGPDVEQEVSEIITEAEGNFALSEETNSANHKAFLTLWARLNTVNTTLKTLSKLTEEMQDIIDNQ